MNKENHEELIDEIKKHVCAGFDSESEMNCAQCQYFVIVEGKNREEMVCLSHLLLQAAEIIEEQDIALNHYRQLSTRNDAIIEEITGKLRKSEVDNINLTGWLAEAHAKYERCRNELCLKCGRYTMRHKGACEDCYFLEGAEKHGENRS